MLCRFDPRFAVTIQKGLAETKSAAAGQRGMARIGRWAEHRWAHRRLSDYIDGELTLRARRRLQRHADGCPDCGPTLRSLIRVVHALRTLPGSDRPSIAPMVIARMREEPSEMSSGGARAFNHGRRRRPRR